MCRSCLPFSIVAVATDALLVCPPDGAARGAGRLAAGKLEVYIGATWYWRRPVKAHALREARRRAELGLVRPAQPGWLKAVRVAARDFGGRMFAARCSVGMRCRLSGVITSCYGVNRMVRWLEVRQEVLKGCVGDSHSILDRIEAWGSRSRLRGSSSRIGGGRRSASGDEGERRGGQGYSLF